MVEETVSMMVNKTVDVKAGEMANGSLNGIGDKMGDKIVDKMIDETWNKMVDKMIDEMEVVVEKMGKWETPTSLKVKYQNLRRSQRLLEKGVVSDY